MKYNEPYGAADPNAPYVNGDPSIGRAGSIPPAAQMEYPQREILAVIEAADIVPSNSDLTQLLKAIRKVGGRIHYGVDVGTKNAMVCDLDPVPSSYSVPMFAMVRKMASANDAAMTVNFNGLGSKSLKDLAGGDLSSGAALGGGVYLIMYDGSQCRMLGGTVSYSTISGLTATGGEVIDVTVGGVIGANFDKPAHNATFHDDDVLVRKLAGAAHVKFTWAEMLTAILSDLEFPAGQDPIYFDTDKKYKIRTAATTQRGAGRVATSAECLAGATDTGTHPGPAFVTPEDLGSNPWGYGVGAVEMTLAYMPYGPYVPTVVGGDSSDVRTLVAGTTTINNTTLKSLLNGGGILAAVVASEFKLSSAQDARYSGLIGEHWRVEKIMRVGTSAPDVSGSYHGVYQVFWKRQPD